MSLNIRLICDNCEAEHIPFYGACDEARANGALVGWVIDGSADLCPVCSGKDLLFWATEPF